MLSDFVLTTLNLCDSISLRGSESKPQQKEIFKGDILMEKATLSVTELAKQMGIGRNQAYALTRREGFPALHIGARILVPVKELENWLRREAEAANAPGIHRA